MKILKEIKEEEFDNEDPFYAPIGERVLSGLHGKDLIEIKNIIESSSKAHFRAAMRYLMALPEADAKEFMIDVSAKIAEEAYKKSINKDIWDDLPQATKKKIRQRIKEEEYDMEAEADYEQHKGGEK